MNVRLGGKPRWSATTPQTIEVLRSVAAMDGAVVSMGFTLSDEGIGMLRNAAHALIDRETEFSG